MRMFTHNVRASVIVWYIYAFFMFMKMKFDCIMSTERRVILPLQLIKRLNKMTSPRCVHNFRTVLPMSKSRSTGMKWYEILNKYVKPPCFGIYRTVFFITEIVLWNKRVTEMLDKCYIIQYRKTIQV